MQHDIHWLVSTHYARVQRLLRRFGVCERDLPDATQDVFLIAHRKHGSFEGRAALTTWLHAIAFRVASQHRRRAHHRREVLGVTPDIDIGSQHTRPETRIALRQAHAALAALDADKREVFVAFELEEQPMTHVAERLGIPLKTAFSRLYAARRKLTEHLSAWLWLLPRPKLSGTFQAWAASAAALAIALVMQPEPAAMLALPAPPPTLTKATDVRAAADAAAEVSAPSAAPIDTRAPATKHTQASRARAKRSATLRSVAPALDASDALAIEADLVVVQTGDADSPASTPDTRALPAAAALEPRLALRGSRPPGWRLVVQSVAVEALPPHMAHAPVAVEASR